MDLAGIAGIGWTKAGELWNRSLVDLSVEAGRAALSESGVQPTAVVVGNALGGTLGDQRNLAAFLADRLGLAGAEVHTVEADEASGGAALRVAVALVQAQLHHAVLVVGAEKTSDTLPDSLEEARARGLDAMREAGFGFGPNVAAGLAMQRYIDTYRVDREDFYHLPRVAHDHAALNRDAFFSWPLTLEQYLASPVIAEPATVCDSAPQCDGAAALVLVAPENETSYPVAIEASAAMSERPGMVNAAMELELPAARRSAQSALEQCGMTVRELSLFELHDSSTVMAALSLEALGLCEAGGAMELAKSGALALSGHFPTWTFGGNKGRGNAPGAVGIYQAVEATRQLRGEAAENQVTGATSALIQCLGSFGSTAVTHVLRLKEV